MRIEVTAQCECGYQEKCHAGGSLFGGNFPALCQNCVKVVEIDLYDQRLVCYQCKSANILFYDEEELCGNIGGRSLAIYEAEEIKGIWRILVLKHGPYYCPLCKKISLMFFDNGEEELAPWQGFLT